MQRLTRGGYSARLARTGADLLAAQRLRHLGFLGGEGRDADGHDALCRHVLVEETATGALVCCCRVLLVEGGAELRHSYSARFYDLSALESLPGRMTEIGRFCIHPDRRDPDILRLAWAALTRLVDAWGVEMLFGCSSFAGTRPADYADAFALLRARHLAPPGRAPGERAARVYRFASEVRRAPDLKRAQLTMPPLLRSYLAMGGWVSDHAVVDEELQTLHVFTGLEIGAIPPGRARLLRAAAG